MPVNYQDAYRKLAENYIGRVREHCAYLNMMLDRDYASLTADDVKHLTFLSHGLSGSAGAFGYEDLTARAGELEDFVEDKLQASPDVKDAEKFMNLIKALYRACMQAIDEQRPSAVSSSGASSRVLEGRKAVIIDDDPDIQNLLSLKLSQRGMAVVVAENPAQIQDVLERENPDLIILDIVMPNADGQHVLQQIKADFQHKNIPVMMLSSKQQQFEIADALHNGAVDYVIKPFHPDQFVMRVEKLMAAVPAIKA